MSDAWMPGAGQLRTAADGGHLKGGAPRAVWLALDADPAVLSARSAAERLSELGRSGHLTWNPLTGEIVQLVPVLRAGRSLGGPEGLVPPAPGCAEDSGAKPASAGPAAGEPARADRLAEVNTEGRLCVQICVVAFAWDPFTAGPLTGLRDILTWLDSWDIPRRWPAGPPAAAAARVAAQAGRGSRRLWARGGHFGASQVPGWAAAGPGEIDIGRLTGIAAPAAIRLSAASAERDLREQAPPAHQRARDERHRDERHRDERHRKREQEQQDRGERPRLADFDEIFEHRAPAAGSLTRVG